MAEKILKILVATVVVSALVASIWLLAHRKPEKQVGSDVAAYLNCKRCGHSERTTFDVVIEKGALVSEVGWQMRCTKCGGPVAAMTDRIHAATATRAKTQTPPKPTENRLKEPTTSEK